MLGFFFSRVQTCPGDHPASYSISNGALSPDVKQQGRETDYSLLSNAEVKNGGAIPLLPYIYLDGVVLNSLSKGSIFLYLYIN
jgi:hypothetical protein